MYQFYEIYNVTRAKLQPGASSPGAKEYGDRQTKSLLPPEYKKPNSQSYIISIETKMINYNF
jgi:hypothetical protein